MKKYRTLSILGVFIILVMLAGCATMPTGPKVQVLPGPGKPFEVFMADDAICRQWANQQIGGASPSQTANQNLATGATVGSVVGAAMGAAIGAATGNAAAGAAIGGATGLLGGTAMGANAGAASEWQLQRRYDIAYQQCMYAKGNQIPGAVRRTARAYAPPPPPPPPPKVVVVVPPLAPAPILQDIHFDFNKAGIGADAAETLKKNVEWFKKNPGKAVRIEGNTDVTGTEKYNMGLGKRRADTAKAFLVKIGIDEKILETVSFGDTKPICTEKDEACWARQRRVHFTPLN